MKTIEQTTINERLLSLLDAMIQDDKIKISPPVKMVVVNLVKNFLQKADPQELRKIIIDLRDNLIPWVLGEK